MPLELEVNDVLVILPEEGNPSELRVNKSYTSYKDRYHLFEFNTPIPLLNKDNKVCGQILVKKLAWENNKTQIRFKVIEMYDEPYPYL